MSIAFAKKILKDNASAVFLSIDLEYYQSVSDRIMDILRSRSEKFEQASIDEAFVEVSSQYDSGYLNAIKVAKAIKEDILSSEKLTSSVGIGSSKLLAKMAADSKKPDGFAVILPGEERSFLGPLPVGKLFGVGPKTSEKLKSINVSTIGELALVNEEKLSDLFGRKLGPSLKDWANGRDESPVVEKPIEQMSRIVTLKSDATIFEFQDVLQPISEDLARKLHSSGLLCKSIGIIGITDALKVKSRSKSLPVPTESGKIIFETASELFSNFFEEEKESRLRRIGIKISDLQGMHSKIGSLEDYF